MIMNIFWLAVGVCLIAEGMYRVKWELRHRLDDMTKRYHAAADEIGVLASKVDERDNLLAAMDRENERHADFVAQMSNGFLVSTEIMQIMILERNQARAERDAANRNWSAMMRARRGKGAE